MFNDELEDLKVMCGEKTVAYEQEIKRSTTENDEPGCMSLFPLLLHFLYLSQQKAPERHKVFRGLYRDTIDDVDAGVLAEQDRDARTQDGEDGRRYGTTNSAEDDFDD
jgi:hypothetical protein